MIRINFLVYFLFVCMGVAGCVFQDDPDGLVFGENATDTGDTASDADTDTDSDTDSDTDGDADSDSDTVSDTVTDIVTDDDTTTSSDSSTVVLEDSDTPTESDTDSDMDSATVSDFDTGSEHLEDTEDTETGEDCVELGWQCGTGDNELGFALDCDLAVGCRESGEWCSDNQCLECNSDAHCGESCDSCGEGEFSTTPRCLAGSECVECLQNHDCPDSRPFCDTAENVCHECFTDAHCRPDVVTVQLETDTDIDTDTATDSVTDVDTDGPDTDTAWAEDTAHPWKSPIGLCTPDNICTCWVPTPQETDTESDGILVGECESDADCPSDLGFSCVRDYDDGVDIHKVCLRECDSPTTARNGLSCANKVSAFVWVPMTTCYAFSKFGLDCKAESGDIPDPNKCRISSGFNDGQCVEDGASFTCTYSCYVDGMVNNGDSMCPLWPEVADACVDLNNLCKVD